MVIKLEEMTLIRKTLDRLNLSHLTVKVIANKQLILDKSAPFDMPE